MSNNNVCLSLCLSLSRSAYKAKYRGAAMFMPQATDVMINVFVCSIFEASKQHKKISFEWRNLIFYNCTSVVSCCNAFLLVSPFFVRVLMKQPSRVIN
jgi:hypothetical protein